LLGARLARIRASVSRTGTDSGGKEGERVSKAGFKHVRQRLGQLRTLGRDGGESGIALQHRHCHIERMPTRAAGQGVIAGFAFLTVDVTPCGEEKMSNGDVVSEREGGNGIEQVEMEGM